MTNYFEVAIPQEQHPDQVQNLSYTQMKLKTHHSQNAEIVTRKGFKLEKVQFTE